jgi:DNA-binding HxlR family transcriptional regulator
MGTTAPVDVELVRQALATSTLHHGLRVLGDRWTVQVMLGTFMGLTRFDQWHVQLGIPRRTLSERLRALVQLGLLRPRAYQARPPRQGYHGTAKAMAMFPQVLMIWQWERRWGERDIALPARLRHLGCGHEFNPRLVCAACEEELHIDHLQVRLEPNPALAEPESAGPVARLSSSGAPRMGLGLRVDRWCLMVIAAVVLGCHHFEEIARALGIAPSVLAHRLKGMVEVGLLSRAPDAQDARRRHYRLTPASRGLVGYMMCLSDWAGMHHLAQPSSIVPMHTRCGQRFHPRVVCSHCTEAVQAWQVQPIHEGAASSAAAEVQELTA